MGRWFRARTRGTLSLLLSAGAVSRKLAVCQPPALPVAERQSRRSPFTGESGHNTAPRRLWCSSFPVPPFLSLISCPRLGLEEARESPRASSCLSPGIEEAVEAAGVMGSTPLRGLPRRRPGGRTAGAPRGAGGGQSGGERAGGREGAAGGRPCSARGRVRRCGRYGTSREVRCGGEQSRRRGSKRGLGPCRVWWADSPWRR